MTVDQVWDLGIPVADDYKPNPGELDNIVYLVCRYTANWTMRQTDLIVCLQLAGEVVGNAGISKLVKVACEYVWDHICGKPSSPTVDQMLPNMKALFCSWYNTTTIEERNDTVPIS